MSEIIKDPVPVKSQMTVVATSQPFPIRFLAELTRVTARIPDTIDIPYHTKVKISLILSISGSLFVFGLLNRLQICCLSLVRLLLTI